MVKRKDDHYANSMHGGQRPNEQFQLSDSIFLFCIHFYNQYYA